MAGGGKCHLHEEQRQPPGEDNRMEVNEQGLNERAENQRTKVVGQNPATAIAAITKLSPM